MTRVRAIHVLVVEDKPSLADRLSIRDDVRVVTATGADANAVSTAAATTPDVVVIGPSVAFARATDICTRLRRDPRLAWVPILVFGSREMRHEEVSAFAAGADDYLSSLVTTPSLVARLQALARRMRARSSVVAHGRGDTAGGDRVHEAVRIGRLVVEPESYCVRVDGRIVELSAGEFRVLWELAVHRGAAVRGEELGRADVRAGTTTSAKTVRSHVAGLRRKLGVAAGQLKTVRGVGYRLVGE
jgi:DNA-binding response OmpR family regulator